MSEESEDKECDVRGSSNEGYCKCIRPKDHEGSHMCEHGWWD